MAESKVAVLIRIQAGLKRKLVDLAKRERRSLNQQIEFLLDGAVQDRDHEVRGTRSRQKTVRRKDK